MRWTERQRAMLREMGVQLWSPHASALAIAVAVDEPTLALSVSDEAAVVEASPAAMPAPTTPSSALKPAEWLVVGAALEASDPRQEQLLDNMLRAIGAARSAPTRARRAAYFAIDETVPADAAALAQAIDTVAPRCVFAFGRAAAAALLGSDAPVGNWRGRCHERGALPVVVTFSLAFLLRHPSDKAKAWDDLCLGVGAALPAA